MGSDQIVGRVHGSVPSHSQWIERSMQDSIVVGAVYEFHGQIAKPLIYMFPDSWLEEWVQYAFALQHPKFRVLGAQIDEDGRCRIQVVALSGSPLLLIGAALVALLSILAGMSIERVFQSVGLDDPPTGPVGAAKDVGFVVLIGGLAVGTLWYLGRS